MWGFWWIAHSVLHLSDPWLTNYIAAPVGTQLGLHALMPLAGFVMLPVTLLYGPSASYTLLSVLLPGLMGYAMYRVAKLWLPSQIGAIAAGVFYGFSAMLTYQAWVHLNLAAGALFLPMTLEAAVRLRRRPGPGQAAVLGLVVGAAMLVDQESAVLSVLLAAAATLPWLLPTRVRAASATAKAAGTVSVRARLANGLHRRRRPAQVAEDDDTQPIRWRSREHASPDDPTARPGAQVLRAAARPARSLLKRVRRSRIHWLRFLLLVLAGAVALIVAGPQLIAILHANAAGSPPATLSAPDYLQGIRLPDMFMPSPRVTYFGVTIRHARNDSTFGALSTLLALIGLLLAWRRRNAWLLAVFFVVVAALSVGSDVMTTAGTYTPAPETYYGVQVSSVLPFTWFVHLPGLSGYRTPSRIADLGLISIALLAGYTVNWLRYHARLLLIPVVALAVLEAGLGTPLGARTMATHYPALDQPIAADHSGSIVLDIPFGLRGGAGVTGLPFVAQAQVLATADGHPLADALLSRVPTATVNAIEAEPFYHDLISAQTGRDEFSRAELLRAAKNAAQMRIGWVLLWEFNKHLRAFLVATGFGYAYRADGASVWRPDGLATGIMTNARHHLTPK